MVETLVSAVGPLEDPNAHQVLQNWILDTSPSVFGHLFARSDQIPPELIIGQTLRKGVVVPLVCVELQPILLSLPKLHTLCDLRREGQIHQFHLGLSPTCWLVGYPNTPPPTALVEWLRVSNLLQIFPWYLPRKWNVLCSRKDVLRSIGFHKDRALASVRVEVNMVVRGVVVRRREAD